VIEGTPYPGEVILELNGDGSGNLEFQIYETS